MQVNWKRAMNLVGCDWLDVISFEEINSINEAEKQHRPLECFSTETNGNNLAQAVQWTNQLEWSKYMQLMRDAGKIKVLLLIGWQGDEIRKTSDSSALEWTTRKDYN